jgi:hypothetical protein
MRTRIKVLIALWVLLLLGIAVLFYNAYTKLHPEVFISVLTEQVQRNYPGAKLEVGSFDYRASVDFNVALKDIKLRRSDKIIAALGEIEIRLPWWLLLFQQGIAQINLNGLTVFVDDQALEVREGPSDVPERDKFSQINSSQIKLNIPDYLVQAQFTLRAKDVKVTELGGSRNYFTISKLLVKEFQFGKNSAFELIVPISISHNKTNFNSELWLFGDLTPERHIWDMNFKGEFRTNDPNEKIQFDDLIIDGRAKFLPHRLDINSKLTFFLEKKEIGQGEFSSTNKNFQISLQLTDFPLAFLALFEKEIKSPYLPDLTERAQGKVDIKKQYDLETLKLKGHLDFPGVFRFGGAPENDVAGKWRLSMDDSRWETSFISPKGEISFFRRSVIDFKQGSVIQFFEELGFTDVEFSRAVQLVTPLEKILTADPLAYSSTAISFKRCLLGDKTVEGAFRYGISPGQRFYSGEIKVGNSSLKVAFNEGSISKQLDLEFAKFNWIQEYGFFAPYFEAASGVLDGNVQGRWSTEWATGKWLSRLTSKGLTGPKGDWITFIDNCWSTFNVESSTVVDQSWNASLKNGVFGIESLLLEGVDPAKIDGQIDTNFKKKSYLTLTYPKNKKWKPVRQEITTPIWQRNNND